MKLHDYYRSSSAFRVRIALNLKGLDYQVQVQDLDLHAQREPSYLALNPHGLLPALEVDGQVLGHSAAILEYLEERFPTPALLPADPAGRARVRALFHHVAGDIHPLTTRRVLAQVKQLNPAAPATEAWKTTWLLGGLRSLEAALANHPATGHHCHGDTPSFADIALVPQMVAARLQGLSLDGLPTLERIYARCMGLSAFRQAHPDHCASRPVSI